jgi:dienelactone hydrolase
LSYKLLSLLSGVILLSTLTGGCSSSPAGYKADRKEKESRVSEKEQKIDEVKVKDFTARGYDSGTEYAIDSSKLTINLDNVSLQLSLVHPRREGKYPLVLYLPGLGETSDAGSKFRNAWATSGFAVISIQLLSEDETIFSTPAAREGDFSYIRHDRYSTEVVSNRLKMLAKLIEYIKKEVEAGDTNFSNIDLEHFAIVGFDIGANSAMIEAGEEVPSITNSGIPLKVAGVIALSPYTDFSGSAFNSRFQNINVPVLSVTSDADDDSHGVVPITLHQAPFQYMPTGDKYLLLLAGASHAVIGNGVQGKETPAPVSNERKNETENVNSNKGSGRGRGGRNGKKSSENDSSNSVATAAPAKRPPAGPTQRAMMEVSIEKISTAFLNAYMKNDSLAKNWLSNEAQPWLYNIGQLKGK